MLKSFGRLCEKTINTENTKIEYCLSLLKKQADAA
jgi:hypothetical protein